MILADYPYLRIELKFGETPGLVRPHYARFNCKCSDRFAGIDIQTLIDAERRMWEIIEKIDEWATANVEKSKWQSSSRIKRHNGFVMYRFTDPNDLLLMKLSVL